MKLFLCAALILLISRHVSAQETFHCTHVQVCNLASSLAKNKGLFKMIHGLEGMNPHHSSPSVSVYKTLKKSNGILFAPLAIEPWFKGYEGKSARSYRLDFDSLNAHFWLHPKNLCEAEKQLRSHFIKFSVELKDPSEGFCKTGVKKADSKKFVVLTHESLQPLLTDMGHDFFIINTHDEHHDLSPKILKELAQKIKEKTTISWIIESQFHHPEAIKKMIKKNHRVLELNTIGLQNDSPDLVLKRIIKFLEEK